MKKYKRLDDFYLEEDENDLISDLLPEYYIEQNIDEDNINVEYAARFLQNELNSLLNSFINGGFSCKGYLLYPLVKDISMQNITRIKRLKKIAIFLNNKGHDFSKSINEFSQKISGLNFAKILSALYQDFSQIKNKNAKPSKKNKCKELDISSYRKSDLDYLSPLKELKDYSNDKLKNYLSGFYLHGSLATKDYTRGWSDVDTLSIISKKTINELDALLGLRDRMYRIRYYFYRIDPLQHHGSIAISEYDLSSYCQAYFPLPVFNYAKSFFKDDRISSFMVRDFSSEAIKKMFWFVNYFRKLNSGKKFNLGSYDTKTLLHSITLFPTLYLQAKGILVYKKFSFGMARKDFSKNPWKIIDDVSHLRSNWKNNSYPVPLGFFSKINPLVYYQLNSRIMDLFKNAEKINGIDTNNIIKSMYELSEEAWSRTKENAKSKKL